MSEEVAHLGWRSAAKVQPPNRFRVLLIKNGTTDFFLLPPTLITALPQPSVPHQSRIIIPSILMNEGGHSWLKQLWTQAGCTSHYHTNHDSKHSIIRTAHYYTALHWPFKTGNITREEEGAPDQEKKRSHGCLSNWFPLHHNGSLIARKWNKISLMKYCVCAATFFPNRVPLCFCKASQTNMRHCTQKSNLKK